MEVNPAIFKAYDIRGIYPEELDENVAFGVGRAFATLIDPEAVVLGHDMRLSGPALLARVAEGLQDQGVDVVDIGMVSTDQYYYACSRLKLPGIMVTASHNPKAYNGFKMVRQMPYLLSGQEGIQDIRRIIETESFSSKPGKRGEHAKIDLSKEFADVVLNLVDVSAMRPLKVAADTSNGMVGPILKEVYSRLPVELIGMYLEPDGNLPNHGLDPLQPENRAELERRVVQEKADVGFAFDGDGDRFFSIDDQGRFVSGDFLTALLAQYQLTRHSGSKIVYDVRASWAVPTLVRAAGGTPLMERVGHAFIKRRMADEDALFGGEVTGHYYFRDFNFADSGIIPSLFVLEMLSRTGKTMSQLLAPLEAEYFISGEINSTVSDQKAKIEELSRRYSDARQERMDGISVIYDTWHFNVRGSNTEPLLRLNLEALDKATMERRRDEVLQIIRS